MSDYKNGYGYTHNKQLSNGLAQLIENFNGDYFITVVFNRTVGLRAAEASLDEWYRRVNKKLNTKQWYNDENAVLMQYIAVVEHVDTNLHWHMSLKYAGDYPMWKFKIQVAKQWKKLNASGNLDVKKIITEEDNKNISGYMTKDTWKTANYNNFKLSA